MYNSKNFRSIFREIFLYLAVYGANMKWLVIAVILVGLIGITVAENPLTSDNLVLLSEDFEGDFPPAGWQVLELGNSGGAWKRNDVWNRDNFAGSGYCAIADSDRFGYEMETELRTPVIDLKGCKKAVLEFSTDFRNDDDVNVFLKGRAEVLISTDGGKSWDVLLRWTDDRHGKIMVDLTQYVGKEVIIAWHYYGDNVYWWEIDDVRITAEKPSQSPAVLLFSAISKLIQ
jgi:hypothetical protein